MVRGDLEFLLLPSTTIDSWIRKSRELQALQDFILAAEMDAFPDTAEHSKAGSYAILN